MPVFDVFVVRHAQPDLRPGEPDSGILLDGRNKTRVKDTANAIASLVGSSLQLNVFSSPARRTLETAQLLVEQQSLQDKLASHGITVIPSLEDMLPEERLQETLSNMARTAILNTDPSNTAGIIVVTHSTLVPVFGLIRETETSPEYKSYLDYAEFERLKIDLEI